MLQFTGSRFQDKSLTLVKASVSVSAGNTASYHHIIS